MASTGEGSGNAPEAVGREWLPVAIIGAGPVGLVAAAHVVTRGEAPLILEAGSVIGASVRRWAHVRLFSPWKYLSEEIPLDVDQLVGVYGELAGRDRGRPADPAEVPDELIDGARVAAVGTTPRLATLGDPYLLDRDSGRVARNACALNVG